MNFLARYLRVSIFCAVGLFLFSREVFAVGVLSLSHSEIRLEPDGKEVQLYAENSGDSPLFLDVEQQLLVNPGHLPEELLALQEVKRPSLLITPNRLTLAPGHRHRMTLKMLRAPSTSKVWRLTFRPRHRLIVETGDSTDPAPLALSIGYGVVIYQIAAKSPPHHL
ncbi:hypothetical protein MKZ87_21685 [Pseudomonas sp. MCal1]|uniref:hypothetical protein n=1 Tax=Pseudomonas sp. MCal1 TaxID=2919887 RepID=UPI00225273CF|nr:hypothetical protein [Pseudomonas sp. MCal1]MCX4220260.1 hypothetical protein [Pseudomonas sp. MCal1]